MDLAKFVSLLDTKSLFFARADKLGDPFEGSYPKQNLVNRQQAFSEIENETGNPPLNMAAAISDVNSAWTRYHAISCWHLNTQESAAMWKIYVKSDEGIAIRSSFKRLKEAIVSEKDIFIGKVKYIDYDTDGFGEGNTFSAFLHKRQSFEHERELRAIATELPVVSGELDLSRETIRGGLAIEVDASHLIDAIYIAPTAPSWFLDVVKAIVSRFGYSFTVHQSRLSDAALY
jgi:hypothetical protein